MSHRFLRHVPLLLVDFPETDSLMQIYRTFNGGMIKLFPSLRGEADAMTEAMIEVYTINQKKFTAQQQPQYIYSPRELSRWVRGIYEAIVHMDAGLSKEELCRIWAHEGSSCIGFSYTFNIRVFFLLVILNTFIYTHTYLYLTVHI